MGVDAVVARCGSVLVLIPADFVVGAGDGASDLKHYELEEAHSGLDSDGAVAEVVAELQGQGALEEGVDQAAEAVLQSHAGGSAAEHQLSAKVAGHPNCFLGTSKDEFPRLQFIGPLIEIVGHPWVAARECRFVEDFRS